MARTWFARGLRGMIARRIQSDLFRQGFGVGAAERFVDGDFGPATEVALKQLLAARSLAASGRVDEATWARLTPDPLPTLFERCLSLVAAFEGHGFRLAQGNFDGAGITWGIVGYTLSNGEVQDLLARAEQAAPGLLARSFGPLEAEWRAQMAKPRAAQVAWADAMSAPPSKNALPEAWTRAFARLGDEPAVKRAQMDKAYADYFVPAARSAQRLRLASELGVALCFDLHVQNGASRVQAVEHIAATPVPAAERTRRELLANTVADLSSARWREDVRARKLAIARGAGVVHGSRYELASWGLGEQAAR